MTPPVPDGVDAYRASFRLDTDFPGFEGHFPGNPVLPGVCLVQAVLAATAAHFGTATNLVAVKSAKFLAPVPPETTLVLNCTVRKRTEAACEVKAVFQRLDITCAIMHMSMSLSMANPI